jgi:hypothetical protein
MLFDGTIVTVAAVARTELVAFVLLVLPESFGTVFQLYSKSDNSRNTVLA